MVYFDVHSRSTFVMMLYLLLFPLFAWLVLLNDLIFLLGDDPKTTECYNTFTYIWLFVFANACVIYVCTVSALDFIKEIDRAHGADITNNIIFNQVSHDMWNKKWKCVIFITILQMLLFIAYVCVYQIIEPVCTTANDTWNWNNVVTSIHDGVRYVFPCSCAILVPLAILCDKLERKNRVRENVIEL